MLEALAFVATIHESNIGELASDKRDIVIGRNATKHIEKAQKTGLLVLGFVFLIASGALNLAARFL